jgi:hypothetical protein
MIYEFGVMSNKWTLKANDIKVAKMAMCIFISSNVPIAIYSPEKSGFMAVDILNEHINGELDSSEVKKALKSIKKVELRGEE